MADIIFYEGEILFVGGDIALSTDCCCDPPADCCGWDQCPDPDTPNDVPFTLYGKTEEMGSSYIFSSVCEAGPPLALGWQSTGVGDSLGIYCEDGVLVLRYECASASVTFEADLTVVSCEPFIAHATITWSHSSGFGECDIDIDGDFYVVEDEADYPF